LKLVFGLDEKIGKSVIEEVNVIKSNIRVIKRNKRVECSITIINDKLLTIYKKLFKAVLTL